MTTNTNAKKSRPSKREMQLNPSTPLVDKIVTMKLPVQYESTILNEFMIYSQGTMLSMFERLGGLLRMLGKDKTLTSQVKEWHDLNISICNAQLSEMKLRREAVELGIEGDMPEISIPESFKTEFVASHPIVHTMIKLIKEVSAELKQNEAMYMGGVIDDNDYEAIKHQAINVLTGVIDRIAKATYPGKRQGGGYNPAQLARHLREGNRLQFADVPANVREIIEAYNAETAPQETVKAEVPAPVLVEAASKKQVKKTKTPAVKKEAKVA